MLRRRVPGSGCGGWDVHGKGEGRAESVLSYQESYFCVDYIFLWRIRWGRCSRTAALVQRFSSPGKKTTIQKPLTVLLIRCVGEFLNEFLKSEQQGKKLKCCGSSLMRGGFTLSRCWGGKCHHGWASAPGQGRERRVLTARS